MVRRFLILALFIILDGRMAHCTKVNTSESNLAKLTMSHKKENVVESTDLAIHNVLNEISNRVFRRSDTDLISLMKKGIDETVKSNSETTRASIEAGAKKAQQFVTDVTAAYTRAIFRANTAQEAEDILLRFQDTVQRIVDYAKNVQFAF